MQRLDFQVPVVIPLNLLNEYRTLLLSGGLKELPNPFKRTTTYNELKLRYAVYCQSKNLAFHDPRPLQTYFPPKSVIWKKLGLQKPTKIVVRARENGIISFHTTYSTVKHLSPLEIKKMVRENEVILQKVAKWFVMILKRKLPSRYSSENFIPIGPLLTFIYFQEKATIRKRKKFVSQISKISGVYRPIFKGDFSIEDDEFVVSGRSFHLFWTQNHIRKKTRYKLIAGIVESLSLANGINEIIKNFTSPNQFSMATEQSWEIFLNFLNPFVLAGKPIQSPLLPANWRSWLIHCSKVYRIRDGYKALLTHLVNHLPITQITTVYRILSNIVTIKPSPLVRPLEINVNGLAEKERFILSIFLISERLMNFGLQESPPPLEIFGSHTLSAIVDWVHFIKSNSEKIDAVHSRDLWVSDLLALLQKLKHSRKQMKLKYGHLQGENATMDPFSFQSIRMTLESLVNKGILESYPFKGRGRGKDKMKYSLSRNFSEITSITLRLINQTMPEDFLFKEDEIGGIIIKALV